MRLTVEAGFLWGGSRGQPRAGAQRHMPAYLLLIQERPSPLQLQSQQDVLMTSSGGAAM